jgi:hypothetical protein
MKFLLLSLLLLYTNKLIADAFSLNKGYASRSLMDTSIRSSLSDDSFDRTFASYVVYKSKAAVSLKAIPPTFQPVGTRSRNVAREGGLLFEFAASTGDNFFKNS